MKLIWKLAYNQSRMKSEARDIREEILELVFPDLRYGGEPDVERYFELRSQGRMLDALVVYRSRLKVRYPDDNKRIALLGLYRQKSPQYAQFLRNLLLERADDIISRIKSNVDALVLPLEGLSMKNTYRVLKAVEIIVRLLPSDPDNAEDYMDVYENYSRILDYRYKEMKKCSYLVHEFFRQTMVEDDVPTDYIEMSLQAEEEKRRLRQQKERQSIFDLSKIEFEKADIARIEIPAGLERDEDRTLAFCHKYWHLVHDPGFERIIWLYSRKYGTRHYEVFKTIKLGRTRKYSDDDILSRVATTIAERYSYTVQGDLYMQAAWRRLKAGLYGMPLRARAPEAAQVKVIAEKKAARRAPLKVAKPEKTKLKAVKPAKASPVFTPPGIPPMSMDVSKGSISDRIKRLSGSAYDVYRDIFLDNVRIFIRAGIIGKNHSQPGEKLNKAEDITWEFMEKNYFNTFMDWSRSKEKQTLESMGFKLDELDSIIERCYIKIRRRT